MAPPTVYNATLPPLMFLVSGTKRSGTSMWMQILSKAGVEVLGQAFPRNWGSSSLREANPDGFYETLLRQGIYFSTNPHPVSGEYFMPTDVSGYAVKVFVPGVVRSERAYIDLLIANIRPWREYEASINRLYDLEHRDRLKRTPDAQRPFTFPPAMEWWMENFALVRDLSLRKYDYQMQTYAQVLTQPQQVVPEVLARLGLPDLNIEAAIAAVKPNNQTQSEPQRSPDSATVEPDLAEVFDELYVTIQDRRGLKGPFLKTLNATNKRLLGRLAALQKQLVAEMAKRGASGLRNEPVFDKPRTQ